MATVYSRELGSANFIADPPAVGSALVVGPTEGYYTVIRQITAHLPSFVKWDVTTSHWRWGLSFVTAFSAEHSLGVNVLSSFPFSFGVWSSDYDWEGRIVLPPDGGALVLEVNNEGTAGDPILDAICNAYGYLLKAP